MSNHTLKDHITGRVKFVSYKGGELWYVCENTGFEFPVPISDTDGAEFLAEDKGILLMRWIKKHMAMLENVRPI